MKKQTKQNNRKHKRALASVKRRKAFAKQKHLWTLGIGLYETTPKEERN
jgi:hypothetical protein